MKNHIPKIRRTFRLQESTCNYIVEEANRMNVTQTECVEHIIKHYQKAGYLNNVEDVVTRTHKSVLYTDRAVQQILEMLNMMCFSLSLTHTIHDDRQKTEIYLASADLVKKRIKAAQSNRNNNLL